MRPLKYVGVAVCTIAVGISCWYWIRNKKIQSMEYDAMFDVPIKTFDDAIQLFPKTMSQISACKISAINKAQQALETVKAIDDGQHTFANTFGMLDTIQDQFSTVAGIIRLLEMVSPDKATRDQCHAATLELNTFSTDAFLNKDLYHACKQYVDGALHHETISSEQRYVIDETMKEFKRSGFALPDATFKHVKVLSKKLGELDLAFETNIANDKSYVVASHHDLAGLSDAFVAQLERVGENYKVTCDYPVYTEVMNHCSVSDTRKKLYRAFNNRAYPDNIAVLDDIIKERDALAKLLGYESYAALSLESLMAKDPGHVTTFIADLAKSAHGKAIEEYQTFAKELPEGITLVDGKFQPWDVGFVKTAYKKKHFAIDDRQIAQYFEVDATLTTIFTIYQNFLGLRFFMTKPAWSWHDDVRLIEVYDTRTDALRGHILLDLYPREYKYSHACWMPLISARKKRNADGTWAYTPVLGVMIANFPKATPTTPALLKHADVETFFHEFGHAMHSVLGATEMAAASGTSVKRDFVEVPSQMFEEWMFDHDMLHAIGRHYQTHATLPDELIKKIVALKKFDSGSFVVRQCALSMLALDIFGKGGCHNVDQLAQRLHEQLVPMVNFDPTTHFHASFGHLAGYGAAYYSYMWSKVYALDLFYAIKEQGLSDSTVGKQFVDSVLSRGGSTEPDRLLKDFLGRAPNQKAFAHDLGFEK